MKRKQIFFVRAGYILGAIMLAAYWLFGFQKLSEGEIWAGETYYNLPVTVSGLFIVVAFFTVAWFWTIRKYWNGIPKDDQ